MTKALADFVTISTTTLASLMSHVLGLTKSAADRILSSLPESWQELQVIVDDSGNTSDFLTSREILKSVYLNSDLSHRVKIGSLKSTGWSTLPLEANFP